MKKLLLTALIISSTMPVMASNWIKVEDTTYVNKDSIKREGNGCASAWIKYYSKEGDKDVFHETYNLNKKRLVAGEGIQYSFSGEIVDHGLLPVSDIIPDTKREDAFNYVLQTIKQRY